jgi:enolase
MEEAGIKPGTDGGIGLDVAASQLFSGGKYNLGIDDKHLSTDEMISMLEKWVERYPILSIEDGLSEDDWDGWVNLTRRLGNKVQIIGDDLFVTARTLLLKGIDLKCANAILIKPNQVGTITETIETMKIAFKNNFKTIVSARSGDTEDNYIADFAVGTNAGQIKIGANTRSERLSKYNQLLRIEEVLANNNISEIEFSHE